MTVIRVKHRQYVNIARAAAQDERLSWEARGMLAYLMSKPDDWIVQKADLQRAGNSGRDRTNRIIGELRENGYMRHVLTRDPETQVITGHEWVITDEPEAILLKTRRLDEPESGKPVHIQNRDSYKIENPTSTPTGDAPKTPTPASTMNPLKDAIASAFGWKWESMTGREKGQVRKAAKELASAEADPDDVALVYGYCARRFDHFTPLALASHLNNARGEGRQRIHIPEATEEHKRKHPEAYGLTRESKGE